MTAINNNSTAAATIINYDPSHYEGIYKDAVKSLIQARKSLVTAGNGSLIKMVNEAIKETAVTRNEMRRESKALKAKAKDVVAKTLDRIETMEKAAAAAEMDGDLELSMEYRSQIIRLRKEYGLKTAVDEVKPKPVEPVGLGIRYNRKTGTISRVSSEQEQSNYPCNFRQSKSGRYIVVDVVDKDGLVVHKSVRNQGQFGPGFEVQDAPKPKPKPKDKAKAKAKPETLTWAEMVCMASTKSRRQSIFNWLRSGKVVSKRVADDVHKNIYPNYKQHTTDAIKSVISQEGFSKSLLVD